MKKSSLYIILGTGVALAGIFSLLFFMRAPEGVVPTPTQASGPTLHPKLSEIPDSDSVTLDGIAGPVTIKNFYRTAANVITPDVVVVFNTDSYTIEYFGRDNSFGIVLLKKPLAASRQEAEAAFLEALAVSRPTACMLRVSLGVPYSVEPAASGTDFGLSFCGNGIPLPSGL
ncbi:MAG: hypothetical protein Q8Q39_00765 [bacterium]|nr:hypothetical protein [bacterium]